MDITTLGSLGSFLSGVTAVVSLLGIFLALSEIRRTRRIVDRETDFRIYDMMLDLDKFFIENPDLKPYIYDGATLPEGLEEGSPEYHRIMGTVELVLDFMDCAYSQFDLMPIHQRMGWIDYFIDIGASSPLIREMVESEPEWYLGALVHLILTGKFDPRLDKSDALKEWRRINEAHWRNRFRAWRSRQAKDAPEG
jgi:hypothetical protein